MNSPPTVSTPAPAPAPASASTAVSASNPISNGSNSMTDINSNNNNGLKRKADESKSLTSPSKSNNESNGEKKPKLDAPGSGSGSGAARMIPKKPAVVASNAAAAAAAAAAASAPKPTVSAPIKSSSSSTSAPSTAKPSVPAVTTQKPAGTTSNSSSSSSAPKPVSSSSSTGVKSSSSSSTAVKPPSTSSSNAPKPATATVSASTSAATKPITSSTSSTAAKPASTATTTTVAVKPKPKSSDSDSDSDDDIPLFKKYAPVPPKPAPVSAPTAAVAKKPSTSTSASSNSHKSSSNSNSSKSTSEKKSPASTPVKKRKVESESEDEDDDEEEEEDDDEGSDDDDTGAKSGKKDAKAARQMKNLGQLHSVSKYTVKTVAAPLKEAKGANKWWNRPPNKGDTKWETLDHHGPLLAPEYIPHKVPIIYDGKSIELIPEVEEVASMYAAMLETDFAKSAIFNKNFFRDWRALPGFPKEIKELIKCDFRPMYQHIMSESAKKKLARKVTAAKNAEKAEKARLDSIYGYALVDGFKEKMANYRVEPPGLFRGRGTHPKTGTLKHRVQPEDIIINIGHNTEIPIAPAGHQWKGVIHNNTVTWLAFWNDNVNGAYKYMWLSPSSRFKGESDIKKYGKAQKLKSYIKTIRENYNLELGSKHYQFRQRATAIYLIDVLALRVGNEKDTGEVADTVGCCSLRVEHLKFQAPSTITLDFLGKDSMRYFNTVEIAQKVYNCLSEFCKNKKPTESIFDAIDTSSLNDHLKSLMEGLTAKVFRTYNASITLQKELHDNPENSVEIDDPVGQKMVVYNRANREVAILCNHQRSIPKAHESQMSKLNDTLEAMEDEQEALQDALDEKSGGKRSKGSEWKANREKRDRQRLKRAEARRDRRKKEIEEKAKKENKTTAEINELLDEEDNKELGFKIPSELDKLQSSINRLELRVEAYKSKIALKDDSKTVALGTSKINYMDPRITVAWCKARDVPIEKIFNKSLLAKFPWAMEVNSGWRF